MGGVGAEEEASGRAMTSSMVEAVFMLLQKSGVRGIDMYSGSVANMLLNHVIQEVLGEYGSYRGALNAQWRRTSEALARGEDENGAQSICSLNNIAVSADYVMRLCAELSGQAHKTLRAAELKQTQALLDEMRRLAEAWEAESTSLLQGPSGFVRRAGEVTIGRHVVGGFVRSRAAAYSGRDHEPDAAAAAWQKLEHQLGGFLDNLQQQLVPTIYDPAVEEVARVCAEALEAQATWGARCLSAWRPARCTTARAHTTACVPTAPPLPPSARRTHA